MENNNETAKASSTGITASGLLGIAFIVLKLVGIINWSWLWVLAPFWIPIALVLLVFIIYIAVITITILKR